VAHKDEKSRLGRWAIELSAVKYKIRYKPGKEHANADFLSRIRVVTTEERKTNYAQKNSLSGLIVILPGESHKVALSRQEPRVQENHTTKLRDPLDHAIKWENWATAKEIFDQILDVDPLHRRSPSPHLFIISSSRFVFRFQLTAALTILVARLCCNPVDPELMVLLSNAGLLLNVEGLLTPYRTGN
jgi:hypothetical protein